MMNPASSASIRVGSADDAGAARLHRKCYSSLSIQAHLGRKHHLKILPSTSLMCNPVPNSLGSRTGDMPNHLTKCSVGLTVTTMADTENCYIISYDLAEGGNYAAVFEAIKAYGVWAHITESTWAIVTDKSATAIRGEFEILMPKGSRIFVIKSGKIGAWRNVMCRSERPENL